MVCVCVCGKSRVLDEKCRIDVFVCDVQREVKSIAADLVHKAEANLPDSTVIRLIRNSEPSLFWRARKIYCEYCIDNRRPRTDESGSNGRKRIYFILVSPQKNFFSYLSGMNVKQNTLCIETQGCYEPPPFYDRLGLTALNA